MGKYSKRIRNSRQGRIDFDIYDLPSREKVQQVLNYIGINEKDFIDSPTTFLSNYQDNLTKLHKDDAIALINMVCVKQSSAFKQEHLHVIYLIAGELVGSFLGYAVRSYVLKKIILPEKIDEIYEFANTKGKDINHG